MLYIRGGGDGEAGVEALYTPIEASSGVGEAIGDVRR